MPNVYIAPMQTVQIDNKIYELPSELNELSRWQLLQLCNRMRLLQLPKEAQVFALLTLFEFKWFRYLRWRKITRLDDYHIHQLLPLTNFLYSDQLLTKNTLGSYKNGIFAKRLYGPDDSLLNITFNEFIKCEEHYINFVQGNTLDELDSLCAVLFRPKRKEYDPTKHNDIREPFNDLTLPNNHQRTKKWPYKAKMAVFLYYHGSRKQLLSLVPTTKNSTKRKGNYSWIHVMDDLAENLINLDKVGNTNAYTVLFHYGKKVQEAEDRAEEIKKLQRK
jgi:hypothetical protein